MDRKVGGSRHSSKWQNSAPEEPEPEPVDDTQTQKHMSESTAGAHHNQLGEICVSGRNVMMGYLHKAEKTRQSVDAAASS